MKLSRDIFRHRGEFARAIRAGAYEISEGGVLTVPKMGLQAFGLGVVDTLLNGKDPDRSDNIIPTEMLNFLLGVGYKGTSPVASWNMGLFTGNITPGLTLTGETFTGVATEFVDYDETARVAYNEGTAAAGSINNHSNRAIFTVAAAVVVPVTVRGAALLQSSVKSDATVGQKCGACSRFGTDRDVVATDILSVGYAVTLTSS